MVNTRSHSATVEGQNANAGPSQQPVVHPGPVQNPGSTTISDGQVSPAPIVPTQGGNNQNISIPELEGNQSTTSTSRTQQEREAHQIDMQIMMDQLIQQDNVLNSQKEQWDRQWAAMKAQTTSARRLLSERMVRPSNESSGSTKSRRSQRRSLPIIQNTGNQTVSPVNRGNPVFPPKNNPLIEKDSADTPSTPQNSSARANRPTASTANTPKDNGPRISAWADHVAQAQRPWGHEVDPVEWTQEAIQKSRSAISDPKGPDLQTAREEIMAVVRPRLKSNVDATPTIYSTRDGLENEADHWDKICHKAYQRARRVREVNATTTEQIVQELYAQNAEKEILDAAVIAARKAHLDLNRMTRHAQGGLVDLPTDPRKYPLPPEGGMDVDRGPVRPTSVSDPVDHPRFESPVRTNERHQTPLRLGTPGVGHLRPSGDAAIYDGITKMIQRALNRNKHKVAEKSALSMSGIKLTPPSPYEGSPELEDFEVFIAKMIDWLEITNMLRPGCEQEQLLLLASCLKGEAATWYYDHVRSPSNPNPREWDLISVVEALQRRFIHTLSHHKAAVQFHAIKQGTKTVQELLNIMNKYADRMVEKPDGYTFRRTFINALDPTIKSTILKLGFNAEWATIGELYREALQVDEAQRYESGVRRPAAEGAKAPATKPAVSQSTRPFFRPTGVGSNQSGANRPLPRPPAGGPNNRPAAGVAQKPGFSKPSTNIAGGQSKPANTAPQQMGGSNPTGPSGNNTPHVPRCYDCN